MAKENDYEIDVRQLQLQFRECKIKVASFTVAAHTYWLVTYKGKPLIEYHGMSSKEINPEQPFLFSLFGASLTKICNYLHEDWTIGNSDMFLCNTQYQADQSYRVVAEEQKVLDIIDSFNSLGEIWNSKNIEYNAISPTTHNINNMVANCNTVAYTLGKFAGIDPKYMTPFDNHYTPGLYDLGPFLFPEDITATLAGDNNTVPYYD